MLYNYFMINIFKILLDFIYERKCYFCAKSYENTVFCSGCLNSVEFLPFKPAFFLSGIKVFSVTYYKDVTQKLIRAVKYHNKKELADFQARLMADFWKNIDTTTKYTVIPVPMFFSKARKRKYNHMDLVCKKFCELTGFECNTTAVIRNRETAPQYKLSKTEREKNLKDAFSLKEKNLQEPIMLVDDISTTGTTLKEIIEILQKNGIQNIVCFVTAIPEKPSNYIY